MYQLSRINLTAHLLFINLHLIFSSDIFQCLLTFFSGVFYFICYCFESIFQSVSIVYYSAKIVTFHCDEVIFRMFSNLE